MAAERRMFSERPLFKCYNDIAAVKVDRGLYARLSASAARNVTERFTVPKKSGRAWVVRAGHTCRFIVGQGPQVGDVNIWNLDDPKERFYSGKTRQIHATHLTQHDRLWSCFPYLRPLATITQDSLKDYGFDEDRLGVHDVIGTRCDPYTRALINKDDRATDTCHQNIAAAIRPFGLAESDVHDVFNIFMCTGFDKNTHQYVVKGSPAVVGDHIEVLAETDLLVALSACPNGDVSIPCGDHVPDEMCFGLDVEIGRPDDILIEEWKKSKEAH